MVCCERMMDSTEITDYNLTYSVFKGISGEVIKKVIYQPIGGLREIRSENGDFCTCESTNTRSDKFIK